DPLARRPYRDAAIRRGDRGVPGSRAPRAEGLSGGQAALRGHVAAGRARRGFRVHRDAGRGRGRDRGVQNGRAARDRRAHSRPRRHAPRRPRVPGAPRVPGQGERASAGPVARHRRPAWRHRQGSPGVGGPVRDVAQAHARAEHPDRRALGAARHLGRSRLRPAARERRRPGPARQRSPAGGYFLLLEHLENESPTLMRTALDRAIESAQGLEPRVLGPQLYQLLVERGRLRDTYASFVRDVIQVAIPNPGLWADWGVVETDDTTTVISRPPPTVGAIDEQVEQISDPQERTTDRVFDLTLQPLTTRFFYMKIPEKLKTPRD